MRCAIENEMAIKLCNVPTVASSNLGFLTTVVVRVGDDLRFRMSFSLGWPFSSAIAVDGATTLVSFDGSQSLHEE